jgi:hypothetical protein
VGAARPVAVARGRGGQYPLPAPTRSFRQEPRKDRAVCLQANLQADGQSPLGNHREGGEL